MKTVYLIIAAGEATRWNNHLGVPKHLAPILGEPIIHRTQRLLTPHLAEGDETYIITKTPQTKEAKALLTTGTLFKLRKAKLNPANGDADKILSSQHLWDNEARTVIIWGDTFLTEQATATIATATPDTFVAVARWDANPFTGSKGGENFAHIIAPGAHQTYLDAVNKTVDLYKDGVIARNGGWEIYKAYNGLPEEEIYKKLDDKGSVANPKLDYAIEIVDGSEDFDTPEDWDNWCWNWAYADETRRHIMTVGAS